MRTTVTEEMPAAVEVGLTPANAFQPAEPPQTGAAGLGTPLAVARQLRPERAEE